MTRYDWLDLVITSDLHDGAKVVAAYLFARASSKTLKCHPKQETVAEETGRSLRSVKRHIRTLEGAGFLVVDRPDAYAVNTYELTSPGDTGDTSSGDTGDTLPSDTGDTCPGDTGDTSSKPTNEPTRENRGGADDEVAVMKAAADAGSCQVFPDHAKAMLLAARGAGVPDPLAWVLSRIADMKARNVKGMGNAQRLVSMVLQDAKAYEPPPKPPEPLRPMTDAELLKEDERWM